eukprot:342352_1
METNAQNKKEPLLYTANGHDNDVNGSKPSNPPRNLFLQDDDACELIETEDVSFFDMVWWLLWKNYKSQCQRRKKAWLIKMLIPVVFTGVLAALRTAFNVDNYPVDYGDLTDGHYPPFNNPTAITPYSTSPAYWAPLTLCDNTTDNPAFLIAIVPSYGANPYIDRAIDQLHASWAQQQPPSNLHNQRCVDYASSLPFAEGWTVKYFNTSKEVDQYCKDNKNYGIGYNISGNISDPSQRNRPIGFGITFNEPTDDDDGIQFSYTIRFNASGGSTGVQPGQGPPQFGAKSQFPVPSTDQKNINNFNRALKDQWSSGSENYDKSSFINVQAFIDNAIIHIIANISGTNASDLSDTMTKGFFVFPSAAFATDTFWTTVQGFFVFFILISFVYPFSQIVKSLVEEKAGKIKEGLQMMGATFASFWVSWYLWFLFEFIIMAACFAFLGKWWDVFQYSDVTVIFVWMLLFCVNLVTYATLVSTIFDNPKVASLIGVFLFIIALYGGFFGLIMNGSQKTALCLLGPSCYSISLTNLAQYETSLIGLQWDNIYDEYQDFAFGTAIWMLLFDSVLYVLLTLYMDKVFPSRYGQRQSPFFICLPRFWCPKRRNMTAELHEDPQQRKYTLEEADCFEPLGSKMSLHPAISIRNLTKHFTSLTSKKVVHAVNGISMDIFSGEVFCLLGHNGAGKTTTISMLTGLIEITSGTAWIGGNNVYDGMQAIRKSLGVCPQHDVLFKRLTVREHLELFCRLKGVPSHLIRREVDRAIVSIGIQDKENEFPPNLSGGQKRKLSLGIALIGGSKIVFLDEPTSGMDPHSRRDAWELIKASSAGRTIILTTHFMDEADILSDRIAIMAQGAIECCGSSLFLKRLYGVGYSMTISVNTETAINDVRANIDDIIMGKINAAQLLSTHGSELMYRLPFSSSKVFPSMFRLIDDKKGALHIDSYGISVTTLEEVFIKVGHGQQSTEENQFKDTLRDRRESALSDETEASDNLSEIRRRSQKSLFCVHLLAMLHKKWHYTKRDKRAMLCQLVLPILFLIFGFVVVDFEAPSLYPRLKLDMTHFGQDTHQIPYNEESSSSLNPFASFWDRLPSEYGSLLALNGGDNGVAYEYEAATEDMNGSALHTYFNSLLAVSDDEPFKYISHYFPIHNATSLSVDPSRHIGVGANVSAYHSLPIAIHIATNLALKSVSNTSQISTYIEPLPTTKQQSTQSKQIEALVYSTYLSFGLAFFPVGIMYNIVYEKEKMCKLQLLISGMNSVAYWLGNCIFDIITILPSCVAAIILIYAFDATSFTGEAMLPFVLIVLLYGISIIPFTYLFSWCFSSSTRAQYITLISFIFLGFGFSLTTFIMDLFESTRDDSQTIKTIVRFSPSYCAAAAMLNLATRDLPFAGLWDQDDPPLAWPITGQLITYMACESVLYLIATLVVEYLSTIPEVNAWFGGVTNVAKETTVELDEDVDKEQHKLKSIDFSQCRDPIVIAGLRKVYKTGSVVRCRRQNNNNTVTAVKDLWFSVPCGQIFGFLGVNGAGKTTTLSMLCGKHAASEGIAYINRIPISNQIACRRMIGFCPQFDAVFDLLTAKEHLTIYGMIKGLRRREVEEEANELITKLTLSPYADKRAGTYSGGNKRKLSVAIAMIGDPPIVYLDEPSTGMDPVSRRNMWDFISQSMSGRSVILTTHSMEECEALCHRIGIMVKGQLRCLGTSQHLKERYGKGFQLDVNIKVDKQQLLAHQLNTQFDANNVAVLEKHDENIKYTISAALSLADMFEKLEQINEKIEIDGGYSLSQTSLEQIFIQMASQNE